MKKYWKYLSLTALLNIVVVILVYSLIEPREEYGLAILAWSLLLIDCTILFIADMKGFNDKMAGTTLMPIFALVSIAYLLISSVIATSWVGWWPHWGVPTVGLVAYAATVFLIATYLHISQKRDGYTYIHLY